MLSRTVLAGGIAALVVWAPLPFGSVLPWAHTVMRLASFALLAAAAWTWHSHREMRVAAAPAGALAVVALLGLLQSLRWPGAVLATLSPEHAALAGAGPGTLSLAPDVSRAMAVSWLAVAALVLTAAVAGTTRPARRVLAAGVVGTALVQALYGIRQWIGRADEIWGVEVASSGRLRGSFVNPDHMALLLEIALAVTLAWLWVGYRHGRDAPLDRRLLLAAPPLLVWLLLFATLSFTGSRAGLVAAIAGALATAAVLAAHQRRVEVGALGLAVPALGVGAVVAVGVQAGLGRWLATSGYELTWNVRLEAYQAAFALWQRFPLTGSGLASFREAFPLVQPAQLPGTWWHAHNDLLELLATMGLIGALTIAAGVAATLTVLARRLREARRSEDAAAVAAASGALAATLVHSCLDFGLTLPANAVVLAVVCGAALARVRGNG